MADENDDDTDGLASADESTELWAELAESDAELITEGLRLADAAELSADESTELCADDNDELAEATTDVLPPTEASDEAADE